MRGTALTNPRPQCDLGRADRLDDVDDSVSVQNRQVGRLSDLGGETVAHILAELDQVQLSAEGSRETSDGKAQPVLAALGYLLDVSA